jgi:predicted ribosome quality control (RQC) complex YloA/Tae2 family protein
MPKLNFVKKARKDNPVAKRGEPYYWWKFAFGSKQYSATRPPRSGLTQSEYFSTLWGMEDGFEGSDNAEELAGQIEQFKSELEELRDAQEEKKENMPESLQESSTGDLLQERYDALDGWIDQIEGLDTDGTGEEFCATLIEEFTGLFGDAG